MRRIALFTLAGVLLLGACGGDDDAGSTETKITSVAELGEKAGCDDEVELADQHDLLATETGGCQIDGVDAGLNVYANADVVAKVVDGFGAGGKLAYGENWTVGADDAATAAAVAKRLGGKTA